MCLSASMSVSLCVAYFDIYKFFCFCFYPSSGSNIIAWAFEYTAHTNRNGYHSVLRLSVAGKTTRISQVRPPEFPESDNEVLKRKRKTKKKVRETAANTNHIGDTVFVVAVFRIIYVSFWSHRTSACTPATKYPDTQITPSSPPPPPPPHLKLLKDPTLL